jgi:transposase
LNRIQHFAGFVYDDIRLADEGKAQQIKVRVSAHAAIKPRCSHCLKTAPGYDTQPRREWLFVPLWAIAVVFLYPPRRVNCPEHGVVVEHIPWSAGKRPVCTAMMVFLARWARRLSWRETSQAFQTSWEAVYRSVEWYVQWGLAHRKLEGIESIGIDEIHWGKGLKSVNFLTVIYQIDKHCRRLLWVGPRRTQRTLRKGLDALGPTVVSGIKFVCTDMWQPYLSVIKARVGHALNVLDRFHITSHLNQAVDKVRRGECARLRGRPQCAKLKHMRWNLLRKGTRVRGKARVKLDALVNSKLATARAWTLKESFSHFWKYNCIHWAGGFLDVWTSMAMRSRLEPMKQVARMLRSHEDLILNWFKAKKELSNGPTEGMNNKIRVVTRRSYGFRTYPAMEIALYHNLGRLPEPDVGFTHSFC